RVNLRSIAEERDTPMAVRHEMVHGCRGAAGVVGEHRINGDVAWGTIEEHDRSTRPHLVDQVPVRPTGRDDQETVHLARTELQGELAFPFRLLVARPGEDPAAEL